MGTGLSNCSESNTVSNGRKTPAQVPAIRRPSRYSVVESLFELVESESLAFNADITRLLKNSLNELEEEHKDLINLIFSLDAWQKLNSKTQGYYLQLGLVYAAHIEKFFWIDVFCEHLKAQGLSANTGLPYIDEPEENQPDLFSVFPEILNGENALTILFLNRYYCHLNGLTLASVLETLIKHEFFIDSPNAKGLTPLCAAVLAGHEEGVEALLIHHPNLATTYEGKTPVRWAESENQKYIMRLLESAASGLDRPDRFKSKEAAQEEMLFRFRTGGVNYAQTLSALKGLEEQQVYNEKLPEQTLNYEIPPMIFHELDEAPQIPQQMIDYSDKPASGCFIG